MELLEHEQGRAGKVIRVVGQRWQVGQWQRASGVSHRVQRAFVRMALITFCTRIASEVPQETCDQALALYGRAGQMGRAIQITHCFLAYFLNKIRHKRPQVQARFLCLQEKACLHQTKQPSDTESGKQSVSRATFGLSSMHPSGAILCHGIELCTESTATCTRHACKPAHEICTIHHMFTCPITSHIHHSSIPFT